MLTEFGIDRANKATACGCENIYADRITPKRVSVRNEWPLIHVPDNLTCRVKVLRDLWN